MAKNTLFDDDDDSGSEKGFAETARGQELKINEEYARRFEHNKKRAELHRLEEKYKPKGEFKPKGVNGDDEDDEDDSSSSDEDEDGFLATEAVDAQWAATIAAIKNKDPKIYDPETKFFNALEGENAPAPKEKQAKAMTLHDYHRERYMAGDTGADDEVESSDAPKTFVQEQADLKKELMAEIKAGEGSDDEDDEDFIKSKPGQKPPPSTAAANGIHPSRQAKVKPKAKDLDISLADKDPDLFLSNYMEARAWAADGAGGSKWEAFESDDGSGNDDADEWEAAYNLRFEDPAKSNEVLTSYSRKVVEARSVRRDEPKGRKRLRELEKERKEEEKRQRHEERARLKRLKVEEAEEKLGKIKKAAGLRKGQPLKDEEWMSLLEDAWENDKWEEEMSRRFGEQYYAELEAPDSDAEGSSKKSKKPKKPKWDDDIDIKDIIPDFEDDEAKPKISLSDIEDNEAEPAEEEAAEEEEEDSNLGSDLDPASDSDAPPSKKRKTTTKTTTKALKAARQSSKRASRLERAKLEALVESRLELQDPTALKKSKPTSSSSGGFRYRETSPQTFGMTPRDILLAPSDSALNDFVGLKKLATFRDRDKKQKDKKRLGKKARLREWRRDVFGREYEHTGPTFGFSAAAGEGEQQVLPVRDAKAAAGKATVGERDGEGGKKKRKRSKGKKNVSA